jgi:hypothetical protein
MLCKKAYLGLFDQSGPLCSCGKCIRVFKSEFNYQLYKPAPSSGLQVHQLVINKVKAGELLTGKFQISIKTLITTKARW